MIFLHNKDGTVVSVVHFVFSVGSDEVLMEVDTVPLVQSTDTCLKMVVFCPTLGFSYNQNVAPYYTVPT